MKPLKLSGKFTTVDITKVIPSSEGVTVRHEATRMYNQWVNDKPFNTSVTVIQNIIDNNPFRDGQQEIRDIIEETGLPLNVADQWLKFNEL